MSKLHRLTRRFFNRSPEIVAEALLGKSILRTTADGIVGGMIVETEAYLAKNDPVSHSHRGVRPRNRSMFAAPGTLYVYSIHAKYCMNAATEGEGIGSAVLIRALEPLWGIPLMERSRGTDQLRFLCRGPARLCQALQITTTDDGLDLCASDSIWFAHPQRPHSNHFVGRSMRIGVKEDNPLMLRFFLDGNPFVSGLRRDHSRRPATLRSSSEEEARL